MDARKNPGYLTQLRQWVQEFREALDAFLELHTLNVGFDALARGVAPAVLPRQEVPAATVAERAAAVNVAAGRAAEAPAITGVRIGVEGAPAPVDPVAAWQTIASPRPLLEAADVLGACDQIIGRLDGLIAKAEAERPPTVGAEAMHPVVWGAAKALWRDGYFRNAVAAAGEAVSLVMKNRIQRNDASDTSLWQQAFSDKPAEVGRARLRWPGNPNDQDVATMNNGLRFFAPGVQMTIRNPATHVSGEMAEQEALERLAALSLLARWVDECVIEEAPRQQA